MIRRALAFAAILAIVLYLTGGGLPRLLGTGCTNHPFGIALAINEDDFINPCKSIIALAE